MKKRYLPAVILKNNTTAKNKKHLKIMMCCVIVVSQALLFVGCETPGEFCGTKIYHIDKDSGHVGDKIILYGRFGATQDSKRVRIQIPGGTLSYRMQVLDWSNHKVVVRIPPVAGYYGNCKIYVTCVSGQVPEFHDFTLLETIPEDCGIRLESLSADSGRPGDRLILYGSFGDYFGNKTPAIGNDGVGYQNLRLFNWSESQIEVVIPEPPRDFMTKYDIEVY